MKTWEGISRMFAIAKKIELFASTLTGITASVICVSSMIVVLNAKLSRLIAAQANKKVKRRSQTRVPLFLLVGTHIRLTSIAVLAVHAETSLLYILSNDLCKLIEI